MALFIASNKHVNNLLTKDLEIEKGDIVCKMKEGTLERQEGSLPPHQHGLQGFKSLACQGLLLKVYCMFFLRKASEQFSLVKTVMLGFVSIHASNCITQNSTNECRSEWKVT